MKIGIGGASAIVIGSLLGVAMLTMAGWEAPPIDAEQVGYRGVGMEHLINPRTERRLLAANQAPEPVWPLEPAAADAPRAGDVYENLQVLGDQPAEQHDRLMAAITEWIAPEEGCGYCHNLENLAEDSLYTKIVARDMLRMTIHINSEWQDHVQDTGVTCYTCHRGQPVPANQWFLAAPQQRANMVGWNAGQNQPGIASASLPIDPFTPFLLDDQPIRVIGENALPPASGPEIGTKATEYTYSLMNHMSESLGVNCTYCHNSRSFIGWEGSPPARMSAWYGIRMVRDINANYMHPLGPEYPIERLGPTGDGGKANCTTCHIGVNKPLYGAPMLPDYPSLGPAGGLWEGGGPQAMLMQPIEDGVSDSN
jgi:photosynthetic reaction center cytochrome c subunit